MDHLRRRGAALAGVSALVASIFVALPAIAAASVNAAPAVAPALHEWTGATGTFSLRTGSRIVLAPGAAAALGADAAVFRDDLATLTGRRLPLVAAASHPGDIVLALGATGEAARAAQGYQLDIDDAVTIRGADATGTFYGEQTVEQLFKLGASLPHGSARDWPDYGHRGFMIDAGRHYYAPADIEQQIRDAAWQKLDVVHLHLTEAAAFRLQSTTYPGLASSQSYSHADIERFVDLAHRYHVTLVPEIDIPAHASAITAFDPSLQWDCAAMNGGAPAFTVDVTKPQTTTFITNLLKEFVPLFRYSPVFHLGGDEYPGLGTQQQCPELVDYAAAHGFASTEDVISDWLNKMAAVVTDLGRRPEIWNWWDNAGGATVLPSKNIIIDAWTGSPDPYLAAGYDTVSSPGNLLYVTPGGAPGGSLHPDDKYLYESWTPPVDAHLLGFEISRWSDNIGALPDAYLNWFGDRPDSVLAAVAWGGPRASSLFAFEDEVDRIGSPPGLPETRPRDSVALSGTPFGSGPAWDNGSSTYDKAFDGDVSTFVDLAQADGGYTGIDLGHESTVAAVRFVPRDAGIHNTTRMVGGFFQGCTDGPDTGCHDLAKVQWRPTYDWIEMPIADQHAYRWLRYVSPAGGFTDVAEIQFYAAAPADASVHLDVPATLPALGDNRVQATVTNTSDHPLTHLDVAVNAYSIDDTSPLRAHVISATGAVPAHHSATVTLRLDVPITASTGEYRVIADVTWDGGRTSSSVLANVPSPISASLSPASVAVTAGHPATASLRVSSAAGAPLTVTWTATPPAGSGVTVSPSHGTVTVAPGATASTDIEASAGDTPGVTGVPINITVAGSPALDPLTLRVSVPFSTLGQAFDNIAITDDGTAPSNLDGGVDGDGSSYSTQALAAAGATPGGTVTHGGVTFTWPDVPADQPDNVLADGQIVQVGTSGSRLGLLTVGTYGPITGTGTVTYTDGSTQPFTITDPDWQVPTLPSGTDVALTTTYHHYAGTTINRNAYIFFHGVDLDASKTVASVTLPAVSDHATGGTASIHVFAVAVS